MAKKKSAIEVACEKAGISPGVLAAANKKKIRTKPVAFDVGCISLGLPEPVAEFKFAAHLGRKFRADWAWPEKMLLLECEGGVWTGGRHVSGTGFLKDIVKYNLAAILGYRLIRCTPKEIKNGSIYQTVREALAYHA